MYYKDSKTLEHRNKMSRDLLHFPGLGLQDSDFNTLASTVRLPVGIRFSDRAGCFSDQKCFSIRPAGSGRLHFFSALRKFSIGPGLVLDRTGLVLDRT